MSTLYDRYVKEQSEICRYLRAKRLLKNVSVLGQPSRIGTVLGEVMKVCPIAFTGCTDLEGQAAYILAWWDSAKPRRRNL